MRNLTGIAAAAAVCALGVSLPQSAGAGALAGANGVRTAADALRVTENVHCVPGRAHRRSPPYDGCYSRSYRYSYSTPYVYGGGYPYGYSTYPYHYSPGVTFGFSFGDRHGYRGHRGWGFGW